MALRNATQDAKTAAASPAFEAEDSDTTVVDRPNEETEAAAAPAPAPAASAALPVVQSNNALAVALRKATSLDDAQGVIGIEALETMGIGTFPRITAKGGFKREKTEGLGQWIKFELVSWNYVTLVTAGENDAEANKLVKSSYDHTNIPGEGITVDQYLQKLKDDGYDKAKAKKYIEVYGMLLATDKKGELDEPQMVQISLSPQSVKQWQRFLLESRIASFKKKNIGNVIHAETESKVSGSNDYDVMVFKPAA